MQSIKAILRSPNFMREVSILLFGFAAFGALFSVRLLMPGRAAPEALSSGVEMLILSIVYVVLGIMIRRGSLKALWATGVLFVLDTLFAFTLPSGKGLGAMIFWRALLIVLLVRYIRRQRAEA